MTTKYYLRLIALMLASLSLLTACTEETSSETRIATVSEEPLAYSRDGLSLDYPSHWTLEYDDPPGLYSDWTVVFDVSEVSWFWIHVYFDSDKLLEQFVDYFVRVLKLETKPHVENYRRMPVTVGEYSGVKLTWTDSRLFPVDVDMRIFRIETASGSVFTIVDLAEEDFDKEWPEVLPILDSIDYKPR